MPHTLQEWQSSLIGTASTPNMSAFQNHMRLGSPHTAPFGPATHAITSENAPRAQSNFQSQHLRCCLSILKTLNC